MRVSFFFFSQVLNLQGVDVTDGEIFAKRQDSNLTHSCYCGGVFCSWVWLWMKFWCLC